MSLADREYQRMRRDDSPPPTPPQPSRLWRWIVLAILILAAVRWFWPPR